MGSAPRKLKILLTGASSFTGAWFAQALTEAGHAVTATFTRSGIDDYQAELIRHARVKIVTDIATPFFGIRFGDEGFASILKQGAFDIVCCHGADVSNYKSPDFDAAAALIQNTRGIRETLRLIRDTSGGRVVLTGSVFEGGEGAGSDGLPHFSPYGLSKALTSEVFRFYCRDVGIKLGKFVIPNPFGPYEEPRFTSYLIRKWRAGELAAVNTPAYVRDNIHVTLLAKAYAAFVESMAGSCPAFRKLSPSGYVETQGAFAERFAARMRPRLDLACELDPAVQTEFPEPAIRINADRVDAASLGWDEARAWDGIADFYNK